MKKYTWEVGKTYSTKEMIQLFGVSQSTWSHSRNKLLDNFKQYYEYDVSYEGRSIFYHILKQFGEYNKPLRKNDSLRRDAIYSQEIIKVIKKDKVQTAKNVSRIIKDEEPIVELNHKEGTVYENTRLRMREMFGKSLTEGGTIGGMLDKVWCGLDRQTNKYFPLSDKLYDEFKEMMRIERNETIEPELELYSDYENGLIEKEEFYKSVAEINFKAFLTAQEDFKDKYGYRPIKVPVYGFYDTDILLFDKAA